MSKSLCFTGHRKLAGQYYSGSINTPGPWTNVYNTLYNLLRDQAIVNKFIAGGAIGFDTLAAQVVLALKFAGKPFELTVAVPFAGQESKWPRKSREIYTAICNAADNVVVVSEGSYSPQKMQIRNEWMINNTDYTLALFTRGTAAGGTFNAVQYALKERKAVGFLDPDTLDVNWELPG